jgi:predicted SAM-dependent methyltransferase
MKLLNIGCGTRFHKDWINIDKFSYSKDVTPCDLKKGIPYPDSYFDVVYHSNLLEHFSKNEAFLLLKDCYRVLIPGGIIRIATPNLEEIVKIYLKSLEEIRNGSEKWTYNYEWILLEMYDQTVRNKSGGEMLNYFLKDKIINEEFVLKRCGTEAKKLIEYGKKILNEKNAGIPVKRCAKNRVIKKIKNIVLNKKYLREFFIKKILKEEYKALTIGRFRLSGEIHQWMYDSYSLSKLLSDSGFGNIIQRTAFDSYIKNWCSYNLDTEVNREIYKPDSFYMEAIKSYNK